uniref:Uncharacterized protein n=1 Tax=Mycena chlorophos TaxID=658473 RepID=A0ABQ0L6M4_MYCCL|nr:predicted protein [Mycena chlorophos]
MCHPAATARERLFRDSRQLLSRLRTTQSGLFGTGVLVKHESSPAPSAAGAAPPRDVLLLPSTTLQLVLDPELPQHHGVLLPNPAHRENRPFQPPHATLQQNYA